MGWQKCEKFWEGLFREADGTPSSTRVLMYTLAAFSCALLTAMVRHMLAITDANSLNGWLSAFPMIVAALIGLITVPYGVNRGAGLMSDLAASYAQVKNAQTAIQTGVVNTQIPPPPPPAPAAPVVQQQASSTTVVINDDDKG